MPKSHFETHSRSSPETRLSSRAARSYITPSLHYSFNCATGKLSISALAAGSPANRLGVRLKDPSKTGWLKSAATLSSGIALFDINESGRYSVESVQASGYFQSYLGPFTLQLCLAAPLENETAQHGQNTTVAQEQNLTQPSGTACTLFGVDDCPQECAICPPCAECSSISCQSEEFCASIGFNRSWHESVKPKEPQKPLQEGNETATEPAALP